MKKIFMLVFFSSFLASVGRADVPRCWQDEQSQKIFDGEFLVVISNLDLSSISGTQVLEVLNRANGHYIKTGEFPFMNGGMMFSVNPAWNYPYMKDLPRERIKEVVSEELQWFDDQSYVQLSCHFGPS